MKVLFIYETSVGADVMSVDSLLQIKKNGVDSKYAEKESQYSGFFKHHAYIDGSDEWVLYLYDSHDADHYHIKRKINSIKNGK